MQFLLEVGSFSMLSVIIASMSDVEMAAHQLVLQAVHLSFLPALALGEAGSVLALRKALLEHSTQHNVGLVLKESGQLEQAQPLVAAALAGFEAVLGPSHPKTLHAVRGPDTHTHTRTQRPAGRPVISWRRPVTTAPTHTHLPLGDAWQVHSMGLLAAATGVTAVMPARLRYQARVHRPPKRTASVRLPAAASWWRSRRLLTTSTAVASAPTGTAARSASRISSRSIRSPSVSSIPAPASSRGLRFLLRPR